MSTPLLHAPSCDAEEPVTVEEFRHAAAARPVLASTQSISLPNGPFEALATLVDALSRRAAAHPGLVCAAAAHPSGDGALLLLTLWESIADLRSSVLAGGADVRAWRARTGLTPVAERALWWTLDRAVPSPEEGRLRLARLRAHGPGAGAFTLRSPVPPPR